MNTADNQSTDTLIEIKKSSKDANVISQDSIYLNELIQTSLDNSSSSNPVVPEPVIDNSFNSAIAVCKINPYYIPETDGIIESDVIFDPIFVLDTLPVDVFIDPIDPGFSVDPFPVDEVVPGDEFVDPSLAGKNGAIPENLTDPICTIMPVDPGFSIDPIPVEWLKPYYLGTDYLGIPDSQPNPIDCELNNMDLYQPAVEVDPVLAPDTVLDLESSSYNLLVEDHPETNNTTTIYITDLNNETITTFIVPILAVGLPEVETQIV